MEFDLYIEEIFKTFRTSIRFRLIYASIIFLVGLTILLLSVFNIIPFTEQLKSVMSISGTLVSSVSTFPIKEVIDRKNRIKMINLLLARHQASQGEEKEKVEQLIWKIIEKNTLN